MLVGSQWESKPGPLTSATSALTTDLWQPDNHQHFHNPLCNTYCTGGTECFSHTPGSHYVHVCFYSNHHFSISTFLINIKCKPSTIVFYVVCLLRSLGHVYGFIQKERTPCDFPTQYTWPPKSISEGSMHTQVDLMIYILVQNTVSVLRL